MASAQTNELPPEFRGLEIKNKLGTDLPGELRFTDHTGKDVTLGDYFDGKRPVLLTLNYYRCESLCSAQLNELLTQLAKLPWVPGQEEYKIVTISFDPRDTTDVAKGKRETYAKALVEARARLHDETLTPAELQTRVDALGWTFLTASPRNIRAVTTATGYAYRFDEDSGQYAHSPVVYVLSPKGTITRYLWGLTLPSQDIKFSLIDASNGEIGTFGDQILMSCFVFDADSGSYGAFAWGFMRIGGLLALVCILTWLIFYWRRERKKRHLAGPGATMSAGPATSINGVT